MGFTAPDENKITVPNLLADFQDPVSVGRKGVIFDRYDFPSMPAHGRFEHIEYEIHRMKSRPPPPHIIRLLQKVQRRGQPREVKRVPMSK